MDKQVHINIGTLQVYGAERDVTNSEIQTLCNVIKKLSCFNKLEDIGLAALNSLGDSDSVALTAQAVLDARSQCQSIRRREAQQNRTDRADATKQRLDPKSDPHARKLYQQIR